MTDPLIQINRSDVAAIESLLSDIKNGATKAMVTAINATVKTTKVQVKKRLGQKLNLKAKRINQDLSVEKANYSKISGAVRAIGEPVGLASFGATQKRTWPGTKVKVYKSSPREIISHAFIATSRSAKNVFWRTKEGGSRVPRTPIERLTGPRIEDVLAKPEIIDPLKRDASDLLVTNLGKKVDDILRRHNG